MNVINKISLAQRRNGSLISLSRWNESTTIYSSTLVPCHCGYRETNNFLFLVPSPKIILGRRRRRRRRCRRLLILLTNGFEERQ